MRNLLKGDRRVSEGGTKKARIEHLSEQLQAEEIAWAELGISLNQITFKGEELFLMQCKIQAMTNCMIEADMSELNLNYHMKEVLLESMRDIRTNIEPTVRQARLEQLQRNIVPKVQMPWEKKPNDN